MEYIKKEELIEGEIYHVQDGDFWMIGLVTKSNNGDNNWSLRGDATYITSKNKFEINTSWAYKSDTRTYRLATPNEKHWLNCCITANKFITFEEAIKTFIPEYVELINTGCRINCNIPAGKIYKCSKDVTKDYHFGFFLDSKYRIGFNKNEFDQYLKPSTKEAYDAQFVVKEPLPQFKVIETIETITKVENNEGSQFFIGDVVISSNGTIQTIESFDYNKAKTNIIAFTNKQSVLGIGIDKIEHYIEPKTDYKILEYKTEGGISCKAPFLADSHQFYINERCKIYSIKRISDDLIITVGDEVLSKTCGVPNKILSIELINNKIRLYPRNSFYNLEDIIKVKEETLLEKAKRLYPVGTKFKAARGLNSEYKVQSNSEFRENGDGAICIQTQGNGTIYYNGVWGEIIE